MSTLGHTTATTMQPADCYKILGVPFGASMEQVTAAYKKLSEKFHPDANAGDPFFAEKYKEVQEAWQTLNNPKPVAPRKKRGEVIGGVIFGLLIIAVAVYKFTNEKKKMDDTEQNLKSMGLLPKDSTADKKNEAPETPAATRNPISIVKDEISVVAMMDAASGQFEVYPSFTIYNAKDVVCRAVLYFYDDEGNHLKTENRSEYTNSDGSIFTSLEFQPKEDEVKYSSSRSDLVLRIPFSKLYLPSDADHVQYELLLYDNNGNVLDKSGRLRFKVEN